MFGCSKEPSHRDGSFEYPQHIFLLRNKKNNFLVLMWRPDYILLSGGISPFPYLCFPSPTSIFVILFARFLEEEEVFLSNVFEGVSPLLAEK